MVNNLTKNENEKDKDNKVKNTANLVGTIIKECKFSNEVYGEKFYESLLEIPRLSGAIDKIPLTISERLININNITKDTKVKVEGEFRSYNTEDEDDKKLKLTVFVKEIETVNEDYEVKNPNKIYLNGFICKDPVYRTTPKGREICDIILAVNRVYNKSDYIPIITWGRNARFGKDLNVGDNIEIQGRIQSRDYKKTLSNGDVVQRTAYEVSVSKINNLGYNNRNEDDSDE
jgi:single-stranded DNA-binding protein